MMWAEVGAHAAERHAPDHRVSFETMAASLLGGHAVDRPDHASPDLASPAAWSNASTGGVPRFCGDRPSVAAAPPALDALRDDILDSSRYVVFDDVIPALERVKAAAGET